MRFFRCISLRFFEASICEYSNYYWLFVIGSVKQESLNQKAANFHKFFQPDNVLWLDFRLDIMITFMLVIYCIFPSAIFWGNSLPLAPPVENPGYATGYIARWGGGSWKSNYLGKGFKMGCRCTSWTKYPDLWRLDCNED